MFVQKRHIYIYIYAYIRAIPSSRTAFEYLIVLFSANRGDLRAEFRKENPILNRRRHTPPQRRAGGQVQSLRFLGFHSTATVALFAVQFLKRPAPPSQRYTLRRAATLVSGRTPLMVSYIRPIFGGNYSPPFPPPTHTRIHAHTYTPLGKSRSSFRATATESARNLSRRLRSCSVPRRV